MHYSLCHMFICIPLYYILCSLPFIIHTMAALFHSETDGSFFLDEEKDTLIYFLLYFPMSAHFSCKHRIIERFKVAHLRWTLKSYIKWCSSSIQHWFHMLITSSIWQFYLFTAIKLQLYQALLQHFMIYLWSSESRSNLLYFLFRPAQRSNQILKLFEAFW